MKAGSSRGDWLAVAAALVTAASLLWLGMLSNPVTPEVADWARRVPPASVPDLAPELTDLRAQALRDDRRYRSFAEDLAMCRFTPQDVAWRDAGYPRTNPWCALPEAHMSR